MKSSAYWVVIALIVVFCFVCLLGSLRMSADCKAKGGVLIRGVTEYVCVNAVRIP